MSDGGMASGEQGTPPIAFFYSRLHEAIRRELTSISDDVLRIDPEANARTDVQSIHKKLNFLAQIYSYHSVAEDEIVYPALDAKVRNVTLAYRVEHADEGHIFVQLAQLLESFCQSASSDTLSMLHELACKVEEMSTTIRNHLAKEEQQLFPLLLQHFSYTEQASMIAQFLFCIPMMAVRRFMEWIEPMIGDDERRQLMRHMRQGVTDRLRLSILSTWVLPTENGDNPVHTEPSVTPLLEDLPPLLQIAKVHESIDVALENFVHEARGLLRASNAVKHLESLVEKHRFLKDVCRFHTLFEDEILFPELLKQCPQFEALLGDICGAEHLDEGAWFDDLGRLLTDVRSASRRGCKEAKALLEQVVSCAEGIRTKLGDHMTREENEVLPLLQQRLGSGEQCMMLWRSLKMMPLRLLERVMPWISRRLSEREYADWIAALRIGGTDDSTAVELLSCWAQRGRFDPAGESDLTHESSTTVDDAPPKKIRRIDPRVNPVDHIFQFHRALRRDFRLFESETSNFVMKLETEETNDWSALVQDLRGRFTFIWGLYQAHSKIEDEVMFPMLESKEETRNISHAYILDHRQEQALFEDVQNMLRQLSDEAEISEIRHKALALSRKCAAVRSELETHIRAEETELWPLFIEHFTLDEQQRIVGLVIGRTGAEVLQRMLPWVTTCFTDEEKDAMMQSLHNATKKTRFDKWIKNWSATEQPKTSSLPASSFNLSFADIFRMNQSQLEAAVRQVSRDSSLEPQRKAYLIQRILASQYITGQQARQQSDKDNWPRYYSKEDGILGCVHYRRNCALVAPCCGEIYVCRLCHDAEQDHKLNRSDVDTIICMVCATRQPVSDSCRKCHTAFARYFCSICRFYDDEVDRDIYHCPFCNICRRGKGLGIDFSHCMECNACWQTSVFDDHKCRENRIEVDCPICTESLFESCLPLQELCCGHVLHTSCFAEYSKWNYKCPICFKSLGDMSAYFRMLDAFLASEPMPEPFRSLKQPIACHDCGKQAQAPYHFVYHACEHCHSYNTRLL